VVVVLVIRPSVGVGVRITSRIELDHAEAEAA
jgi:hypothetical protein